MCGVALYLFSAAGKKVVLIITGSIKRFAQLADAIYHATHKRFYELPITREQIAMAVEK